MVEKRVWDELDKAKDSLYCAKHHGNVEHIIMYQEVVRVLERILEEYYVERRIHGRR